jgi:hypothetical protein
MLEVKYRDLRKVSISVPLLMTFGPTPYGNHVRNKSIRSQLQAHSSVCAHHFYFITEWILAHSIELGVS